MSLTINHNAMAQNAYRNLSTTNGKLSTSIGRMSSGLRVNSAADDAAGLAIREMMRADITTTQQGIRNVADAISMLQTADGSLGIIDEKLSRMKELAAQAASGTNTKVTRDILNSEYQAMAKEIDRIANSTEFNGIKLLDGSVSNQHGGQGIKIHFGTSNDADEDYYFINIGDSRATSSTGLRVGGDAKNDIWSQGGAAAGDLAGPGCCTAGFESLNGDAGFTDGQSFSYGYNWDWKEDEDVDLLSGKYLAGRYTVEGGESLQDLIEKVNLGTQSRVGIEINANSIKGGVKNGGTMAICVGDEAYVFGDEKIATEGGDLGYKKTSTAKAYDKYALGGTQLTAFAAAGINVEALEHFSDVSASKTDTLANSGMTATGSGGIAEAALQTKLDAMQVTDTLAIEVNGDDPEEGPTVATTYATLASYSSGNYELNLWTDNKGNFITGAAGEDKNEKLAKALGFHRVTLNVGGSGEPVKAMVNGEALSTFELKTNTLGTSLTNAEVNTAIGLALFNGGGGRAAGQVTEATAAIEGVSTGEQLETGKLLDDSKQVRVVANKAAAAGDTPADLANFNNKALAKSINNNGQSEFWAMTQGDSMVYVFSKEGGDNNNLKASEVGAYDEHSQAAMTGSRFENTSIAGNDRFDDAGTNFSLGGEKWATMTPMQTQEKNGYDVWNVTLAGRDVGKERDLWIAGEGEVKAEGVTADRVINGMNREAFVEVQNADDAGWAGAELRTQSSAQEALDALTNAIVQKGKTRADIGALQNRLENTMTNLEIQTENLMAAESRISDVDVAKEMTTFTKNNIMIQVSTSMLGQANGMSQMALSLIG